MEPKTVVADIADELTRRVLSGEYEPGDLMSSVRQVADEFEINRATAQLVLGRLESHGIVTAQRARGFVIRDISAEGGVDVIRRVFPLTMQSPKIAYEIFRDVVDTERAIVMDALLAYAANEDRSLTAEIEDDIDELESLARLDHPDYTAMFEKELEIMRRVLTAVGHGFQRAILNSIGSMILDVSAATAAFYAVSADVHVLVWRGLAAVWRSGVNPSKSQLALFEDLFNAYHERVVGRFADLVGVDEVVPASPSAATA